MIITREIINKNILFHDVCSDGTITTCDYNSLSNHIDFFKNFLLNSGVKVQDSICLGRWNGNGGNIFQIAQIFACFELGIKIVISDYLTKFILNNDLDIKYDSKTKCLLPIEFFLHNETISCDKSQYLKKIATKSLKSGNLTYMNKYKYIKKNNFIFTKEDFIATKSATSGTTGAPKCIQHTHEFLSALINRNSKNFSEIYINSYNLNHGSSIFCYAIPAISSKNVTDFYNILPWHSWYQTNREGVFEFCNTFIKINQESHMMLPNNEVIDLFFNFIKDNNYKFENLIVHTLGYIKKSWTKEVYEKNFVKDIISNFGSNETSGPVFLNKSSFNNHKFNEYELIDDFFKVYIKNSELLVTLPIYDKVVKMNDHFKMVNGKFVHIGRSDLIRINDLEVIDEHYQSFVEKYFTAEVIYDQVKSEIYLAIWKNYNENIPLNEVVNEINNYMLRFSGGSHKINKFDLLNYSDFVNGIKLDKEMIREYFRNKYL